MRFICLTSLLALTTLARAGEAPQVSLLGTTADGTRIEQVTVTNRLGMRLKFMDYGATLTAVEVPDRNGKLANVILGMPDLPAYLKSKRRFGTVGRFAGRIGGMRYTLDGKEVDLTAGGQQAAPGFERRVWQRSDFHDERSSGSMFTLVSPAGDQGFPGTVTVHVTYRLMDDSNEFRIEYAATTDAPTVINLTNHSYFNLAGEGESILDHLLTIPAGRFTPVDATLIPTGELRPVAGTPFDFRHPTRIGARIGEADPQFRIAGGYDHNFVLDEASG
ncbi:MAG: aldose epimerase family protein, partial [Gammaproteobacteria bacterium]